MAKLEDARRFHGLWAVAAILLLVAGAPRSHAQSPPDLQDCAGAVGTYLTKNFRNGGDPKNFMSRSLLSLTNGGLAFFTDSGENGEPGYSPFSDGRGAWRCVSKADGKSGISAVILDFTFQGKDGAKQQIARIDFDAVFGKGTGKLEGQSTLYFAPLSGDPLDKNALGKGQKFRTVGEKISAP
jgi:hypothetical protein